MTSPRRRISGVDRFDVCVLGSQIIFADPAGLQTSRQYHLFRFGLAQAELVQHTLERLGLSVLAFLPADEIVGRVAGKVLDGLDAVLAQLAPGANIVAARSGPTEVISTGRPRILPSPAM